MVNSLLNVHITGLSKESSPAESFNRSGSAWNAVITHGELSVGFGYELDRSNNLRFANAHITQDGKKIAQGVVTYHYDNEGRLCQASSPIQITGLN